MTQVPLMVKTLKLSDETHKELSKLGTLDDTYEDVVKRLIEFWVKNHRDLNDRINPRPT